MPDSGSRSACRRFGSRVEEHHGRWRRHRPGNPCEMWICSTRPLAALPASPLQPVARAFDRRLARGLLRAAISTGRHRYTVQVGCLNSRSKSWSSFVQNRGRAALTAFAVAWLAFGGLALAGPTGKAGAPGQGAGKAAVVQVAARGLRGHGHVLELSRRQGCGDQAGPALACVPGGQPDVADRVPDVPRGHEGGPGVRRLPRCRQGRTPMPAGTRRRSAASRTMSPRDASAVCTSCHSKASHAMWGGSQHDQRNVGCTSCHDVHAPKGDKLLKAADETALCATCHRTIVNKQLKFNHMPVREGKMTCASCHNVHGAHERQAAAGRRHHQRVVRQLPRREARADALGARAGDRELRDLPRPARVEQRPDARGQAAVPLPALPRHLPPPSQRCTRATC